MQNAPQKPKKKPLQDYAKYSALGLQMAVIIGLGVWGGTALDKYFQTKFPAFTLGLSLFSLAGAMYWAVKDFIKKQ